MVVEGRRRRYSSVNGREAAKKSSDFRNIAKTVQLYPFIDTCKKSSLVSILVISILYVLVNFLFLALFLLKAIGYKWYTHLLFFAFLCLYVFGGGFAYYSYFAQKEYLTLAYITLLGFVYCPLFKLIYVLVNRILPKDIAYFICSVVEMILSSYIVMINFSLYCIQQNDQRSRIILQIIMFVVQTSGVLLTYIPFNPIIIFPPK